MGKYQPLQISGYETGLVQERQNFLLPNDAYPQLRNAYVWREQLKRKNGYKLVGRLQRTFVSDIGLSGASPWSFNIYTITATNIANQPNAQINPGSVQITIAPVNITGFLNLGPGGIPAYTIASDCEVFSTAHGLSTGDIVTISGVNVVPDTGSDDINTSGPYHIEAHTLDSFKLGVASDINGWGVWASGGTWTKIVGGTQLNDQGNGTLATKPPSGITGTINYETGDVVISGAAAGSAVTMIWGYFPGLPVMGLRLRDDQNSAFFITIAFDQVFAYRFVGNQWQEFIPGTTWNANNSPPSGINFFWTTNYWIGNGNRKIFWATNYSLTTGDPIRYTDGTAWVDFAPQIDAAGNLLTQCLCMVPFRGRMVTFNTLEGPTLVGSSTFTNRIRWAAIGTPFTTVSTIVSAGNINVNAWRDDIRGQGGFLDIPTSENIVSIGFVRDNLVIYCERSTWQLRYTGRSIAPFQVEKVNSENGAEGTFSSVQFDTSLVGIGDKGILQCDSYKSELIDIKIPDFVFDFSSENNGDKRVHGIRDFINRLAYWTVPIAGEGGGIFPTTRLVYNYENDSWALFNDSLTALGTMQNTDSPNWLQVHTSWINYQHNWLYGTSANPRIVGGNQQGYIEELDQYVINDVSLFISNITLDILGNIVITSPNHNMQTGFVIGISGIAPGNPATSYVSLNDGIYGIILDAVDPINKFTIQTYNATTDAFDVPVTGIADTYWGGGQINIRENFSIVSKKFNFIEEGKSIQLGFLDILMEGTGKDIPGAISLNIYKNYNNNESINILPQNVGPDTFFNSIIPTTPPTGFNTIEGDKFWQRVICPCNGNFLTLEYKFSNGQMAGKEQELNVQIDSQILWIRRGGRLTSF